jgi:hypothetical protein
MVATSLSDVVLMRTAERARCRLSEPSEVAPAPEVAAAPEPEPTVVQALVGIKDLLREMTLLFEEQISRLDALNGQRLEETSAGLPLTPRQLTVPRHTAGAPSVRTGDL